MSKELHKFHEGFYGFHEFCDHKTDKDKMTKFMDFMGFMRFGADKMTKPCENLTKSTKPLTKYVDFMKSRDKTHKVL